MSYTNPLSRLSSPLGITNWGSIKKAGLQLMADCLKKGSNTGGEIFVRDGTSEFPILVVFMWESGARFEGKLNHYENDPTMYSVQLSQAAIAELASNSTYGSDGAASNVSLIPPGGIHLASNNGGAIYERSIDTSQSE